MRLLKVWSNEPLIRLPARCHPSSTLILPSSVNHIIAACLNGKHIALCARHVQVASNASYDAIRSRWPATCHSPVPSSSAYTNEAGYSQQQQYSSQQARYGGSAAGEPSSSASTANVLKKSKKKASEVGNNLKKRLSMRYAEPTQLGPGGFSAIPAVPSLPPMPEIHIDDRPHRDTDYRHLPAMGESFNDNAYDPDDNELQAMRKSSETTRTRTDVFEGDPAVDLQLLTQSDFDPQAYLRAKLSHHTESSLRAFKTSLAAAKDAANDDLKRQVFKNYSEFITISKEIATLENDMLELKELLSEWKQLPQALELDDSASTASFSDSFFPRQSFRQSQPQQHHRLAADLSRSDHIALGRYRRVTKVLALCSWSTPYCRSQQFLPNSTRPPTNHNKALLSSYLMIFSSLQHAKSAR